MPKTDRHGDIIERYRYDAFGAIFTGITAPYNHTAYTGQEYDAKTGLVDMNARWYNPVAGRFMTADTYQGTLDNPLTQNRYAYVLNNPINMWDPTGHIPEWVRNNQTHMEESTVGDILYIDAWYFRGYNKDTSDTEEVGEPVFYPRYIEVTYQQTITEQWQYEYVGYKIENDIAKIIRGPRDEYFTEESVVQWTEKVSAEELANRNQEEIANLDPPSNAIVVSKNQYLNGQPYSEALLYGNTLKTEKQRLLQNQLAAHQGEGSSGFWTKALDGVQLALDLGGLIPGIGEPLDGINAGIYLLRGDEVNAALSAAAMIPVGGQAATAGKLVNKAIKASDEVVDVAKGTGKSISYEKGRPNYGKGQVEEVWENAKDVDGKVYDPNTGEELIWDKNKPRAGQWDMGHTPENKYSEWHQKYLDGKISKNEFLQWYRNPNNYRPESPSANRSHKYE